MVRHAVMEMNGSNSPDNLSMTKIVISNYFMSLNKTELTNFSSLSVTLIDRNNKN